MALSTHLAFFSLYMPVLPLGAVELAERVAFPVTARLPPAPAGHPSKRSSRITTTCVPPLTSIRGSHRGRPRPAPAPTAIASRSARRRRPDVQCHLWCPCALQRLSQETPR